MCIWWKQIIYYDDGDDDDNDYCNVEDEGWSLHMLDNFFNH